eukprot:31073-Pelagococcus_subviridis.AAC.2
MPNRDDLSERAVVLSGVEHERTTDDRRRARAVRAPAPSSLVDPSRPTPFLQVANRDGLVCAHARRTLQRGASHTLVPVRPRWRGERRFLRTSPGAYLRPGSLGFNPDTPRRLSTPPDAFQLHPDVRLPASVTAASIS